MGTYPNSTVPTFAAMFVGSKNEYPALVRGGYFASSKWLETGSHDGVMGESFGWYCPTDKEEYRNSKYSFRPMTEGEWDQYKSLECFKKILDTMPPKPVNKTEQILDKYNLPRTYKLARVSYGRKFTGSKCTIYIGFMENGLLKYTDKKISLVDLVALSTKATVWSTEPDHETKGTTLSLIALQ